jgi:hypothetical protein
MHILKTSVCCNVAGKLKWYTKAINSFVSHLVFSWICFAPSLVFSVVFCRSLFVLSLLVIVLSVLHRFTVSDYPFGIFKLFLRWTWNNGIVNNMMFSRSNLLIWWHFYIVIYWAWLTFYEKKDWIFRTYWIYQ